MSFSPHLTSNRWLTPKFPREAYDYTAQGVDGEFTLRRNREVFDWVDIVPRGVVDVSTIQTATEVLGTKLQYPIMVAPSAGQGQLHPQGEVAMYQGSTAAAATPMIVSTNASYPMDKISSAAQGTLWFQLYPREQPEASRELIETAQNNGAKALVITVDSAVFVLRAASCTVEPCPAPVRDGSSQRAGGGPPRANPYRIIDFRLWYDWSYIDMIRPFTKIPILLKGVVTAEDAKLCVEHGIDGIHVSNHGGRSLDYGPSTLEVLPEIVDAVGGKIPVIVDSGFRRGTDIFKALAIGAKAVCLGRVPRWGLGAYGGQGAQRIIEILQEELIGHDGPVRVSKPGTDKPQGRSHGFRMNPQLIGEPPGRIAPLAELVNVFEIQEMAKRRLPEPVYATVIGTNRAALERIIFRPRLMVNVSKLDLSLNLFGADLFTPILIGPVWKQDAFHPEGEIAMAKGAAASKSLMVVSSRASKPLPQIVEAAGGSPLWFQAYIEADPQTTIQQCRDAVKLGCKAVCLTVGVPYQATTPNTKLQPAASLQTTWDTIDRIKQNVTAPLVIKGVLNPDEAANAINKGAQAIVRLQSRRPFHAGLRRSNRDASLHRQGCGKAGPRPH